VSERSAAPVFAGWFGILWTELQSNSLLLSSKPYTSHTSPSSEFDMDIRLQFTGLEYFCDTILYHRTENNHLTGSAASRNGSKRDLHKLHKMNKTHNLASTLLERQHQRYGVGALRLQLVGG